MKNVTSLNHIDTTITGLFLEMLILPRQTEAYTVFSTQVYQKGLLNIYPLLVAFAFLCLSARFSCSTTTRLGDNDGRGLVRGQAAAGRGDGAREGWRKAREVGAKWLHACRPHTHALSVNNIAKKWMGFITSLLLHHVSNSTWGGKGDLPILKWEEDCAVWAPGFKLNWECE